MRALNRSAWMICGNALAALLLWAGSAQASVEISTGATNNMTCANGVCSPTAKKAVLNVNDLTNMLATGDVKITTGNGAQTITVESPFSWTSTHRLTLDAYYNVSFRAAVVVAGQGAVTITTNDGGSGGDLLFFPGAKLDFWDASSSLIINGTSYLLANDITLLAASAHKQPVALADDYDAKKDHFGNIPPIQHLTVTLEGLGHTIFNFTINGNRKGGCTGLIDHSNGTVRDIALSNANIAGGSERMLGAGALVGCNDGLVVNAAATGTLGTYQVSTGGLVGLNEPDGVIRASHANVKVDGVSKYSGGTVYVGGLVGDSLGIVLRSYAQGSVYGGYEYETFDISAGGLAGRCANCDQSFATGPVSGNGAELGGLVGTAQGATNSYATGAVSEKYGGTAGGLAAEGCCISASYSAGAVSGPSENFISGGFIADGMSPYDFGSDYWDIDTSGQTQACGYGMCDGVVGLSDAQMKSSLPDGFDPKIWGQKKSINNGYPYLLANPPPQ